MSTKGGFKVLYNISRMSRKSLAYSHVCVNLSKIAVTLDILAGDDMI